MDVWIFAITLSHQAVHHMNDAGGFILGSSVLMCKGSIGSGSGSAWGKCFF